MFNLIKSLFKPKNDLRKIVQEGAVIIDVRTKGEYLGGNITGSKNIPLDSINKEIQTIKNFKKPIIIVCQSGARSRMAKAILTAAGIETYNGGGWNSLRNKIQ